MATSGQFDKAITSWLTLRLKWVANSQNIAGNTTNVTVTAQLISSVSNGTINSSADKDIEIKINGTSYKSTCKVSISGNTTKNLFSKNVNVAHNADGTKSCAMSCTLGIDVTLSGAWKGDQTVSGTAVFNTIPRASAFGTVSGNTIGSSMTVNITRNSSAFTHQLLYKVGNSSWFDVGSGIATSKAFTIDIATCSQFPNATSGTLQLCLRTYNGSTKIGSDVYKSITVYVPSSVVPTISAFTLTEAVDAIKGKFSGFVNTQSKIAYSVTAAGARGSTIKSYAVSIVGQSFAKSSGTTAAIKANYAGTHKATVKVTDSRGRTAEKTVDFTVYDYAPPAFTAFAANRCLADGTLDEDGESVSLTVGVKVSPVNNQNAVTYSLSYKKTKDSSYTTIAFSGSGYNFTKTTYISSQFSVDNTYNIRFQITDTFTTITKVVTLSSAKPILDILPDGSGMAAGKVAELPNVFDFGFQALHSEGVTAPLLEKGTNFDDVRTPNIYNLLNIAEAEYLNCPISSGTASLEVKECGNSFQKHQILIACSKTNPLKYERFYYGSTWGEWLNTTTFAGKLLWSGAFYMQATQTITLSEAISKQPTGIELVFSRYDYTNSTVIDDDFSHHFVSKKSITTHLDKGHAFIMSDAFFRYIGAKYLKINDTTIAGFASNTDAATANGISFNNKNWILRYVIGV